MATGGSSEPSPSASERVPVIAIPSYDQVQQQSRPQAARILFQPSLSSSSSSSASLSGSSSKEGISLSSSSSSKDRHGSVPSEHMGSFNQAFSFLKKSGSYSPPPPPPPPLPPPPPPAPTTVGSAPPSQPPGINGLKADVNAGAQARNAILVSRRQQGNPVLKHIKNIRWVFSDIVPDYILGQNSCALYLSIRYHLLHPDYLYFRIRELMKSFRLRVILCYVDVEDVVKPLHEVTKTALFQECTLLCAWSLEECARYLETIKIYENKPADVIQERIDHDYLSRLTSALTTIRHVNKTDVATLGSTFGSLSAIMGASMEDLARCPGIGEKKVRRLYDTFHEPFRRKMKKVDLRGTTNATLTSDAEVHEEEALYRHSNEPEKAAADASTSSHGAIREALKAAYAKHGERLKAQSVSASNHGDANSRIVID